MSEEIKIFVINLKRRPDRLESFDKQMKREGLSYEVFEAAELFVANWAFNKVVNSFISSLRRT